MLFCPHQEEKTGQPRCNAASDESVTADTMIDVSSQSEITCFIDSMTLKRYSMLYLFGDTFMFFLFFIDISLPVLLLEIRL